MKIYTKTGDGGETSLQLNVRVAKNDIRIETNGQIDELTSLLGMAIAELSADSEYISPLREVQKLLMHTMSLIAMPGHVSMNDTQLYDHAILAMEQTIDALSQPGAFRFILPGSCRVEALFQYARAKTRTCERRLWTLHRDYPLDPVVLKYMNRLSDYLFIVGENVSGAENWQSQKGEMRKEK